MNPATASIMVIGYDSDFCYLMHRYAIKSAYRIVLSRLGQDALVLARREKPAAIMLEVDASGAICWGVLRALKADPGTRDIPVVICSWLDQEEGSLEDGADVYLQKPILYEDFVTALTNVGVYPCS